MQDHPNPLEEMTLVEFIRVLEESRHSDSLIPYSNSPAKEELLLMLDKAGREETREELNRPHGTEWSLKIYDGNNQQTASNEIATLLREGADIPDKYRVRLEEVALIYDHDIFPWRDKSGKLISLDATQYKRRPGLVSYIRAERLLKSRFPDTTPEEIACWI